MENKGIRSLITPAVMWKLLNLVKKRNNPKKGKKPSKSRLFKWLMKTKSNSQYLLAIILGTKLCRNYEVKIQKRRMRVWKNKLILNGCKCLLNKNIPTLICKKEHLDSLNGKNIMKANKIKMRTESLKRFKTRTKKFKLNPKTIIRRSLSLGRSRGTICFNRSFSKKSDRSTQKFCSKTFLLL